MNLGGDLSPSYEFNVIFYHNCTSDGQFACYSPRQSLGWVPVDGEQNVPLDVEIGDKGAYGECLFGILV
ncbi:unnamed protein product [Caenorhabditis nigoni]